MRMGGGLEITFEQPLSDFKKEDICLLIMKIIKN